MSQKIGVIFWTGGAIILISLKHQKTKLLKGIKKEIILSNENKKRKTSMVENN